jgi:uncharacterized protein (UPF0332 family)
MATMVDRLLDLADQMVGEGARSSALKRRAVSTAYYAVFHALAKSCAGTLLPSDDGNSEVYQRVYRALDHGPLREAFASKGPLKDRDNLKRIGELVVELQSQRERADYMPPTKGLFSQKSAESLVDQARLAVSEIEGLSDEDRIALAGWLLLKSRREIKSRSP